ncbi:MAG: GNAT family N-acetyltransferase [Sphingosinicella sp.]
MKIRLAGADDAAAIAAIYAPYVTDTVISFELKPPDEAAMRGRILEGGALYPWLVPCSEGDAPIGYASASAFRSRPAYRFTVETSVYLAPDVAGRGVGRALYSELLALLARQGFAQAIGAITLPNQASVRLHESLGFVAAGIYRDVGYKLGRWHSVGLWQRPLAPLAERPQEPRPFGQT